jgi:hypothetical protein
MPFDTEVTPVVATASCVVVRTIYEVEGTCTVHLGSVFDKTARVLAFEGPLHTPGKRVELSDSEGRLVLSLPTQHAVSDVAVWINDGQFPTEVFIRVI